MIDALFALIALVFNGAGWQFGKYTSALHRLDLELKIADARARGFRVARLVGGLAKDF